MRRFLPLLALSVLTASLVSAQTTTAPTIKKGVLMVAIEGTYPPFTYKDDAGNLTGYDVELARLLAAKLGLKPEFVLTEWSGILAGLQAGKYDVIINQVGITPERQKTIGYSIPYVYSRAQIAVANKSGLDFKKLEDLKGKKVGVGLGTTFEKDLKAIGGIELVTYSDAPSELADLIAGRVDAIYNDKLEIAYIVKTKNLPVKAATAVGVNVDRMGIAMQKTNLRLKAAIDRALRQMTNDGSMAKLGEKWFGQDISKP